MEKPKKKTKSPWSWKRKEGKMAIKKASSFISKSVAPLKPTEISHNLVAAWQRRRIYLTSNHLQAFRLATKEETGVPIAVDVYGASFEGIGGDAKLRGGVAVLQIYDEFLPEEMGGELKQLLESEFSLSGFFEKKRYRAKDSPDAGGALNEAPVELVVEEYGYKFLVNLNNYLDTGLFLDHRETRKRVERMVREWRAVRGDEVVEQKSGGPVVLNLFAYTGSFSVYAAGGGASSTHTVDLSKTYCDWARKNFQLNDMPDDKHWIYRMETFEFYKYAERKQLKFDLIIIDPPTFSRAKDAHFSVQKDHARLIRGAADLLLDGGRIVFSNNCLDFQMDEELKQEFAVQDIQSETVPQDFWLNTIATEWWTNRNQIHNCFLISKK